MTDPVASCLFCRIIKGEIPSRNVFANADVFAFEDINPQAPFHVLVIPRAHIASLAAVGPEDEQVMGKLMHGITQVARALGQESGGYRVVFNCGEGAGQTVFHIHAHILGGRQLTWPPG